MKYGFQHGHRHSDTTNIKNIEYWHSYIFINILNWELIKIYTCVSKLSKFFIKKSFKRIYDSTFDLYSSIYYRKAKNNVIKM
jgi:hypothetical protein